MKTGKQGGASPTAVSLYRDRFRPAPQPDAGSPQRPTSGAAGAIASSLSCSLRKRSSISRGERREIPTTCELCPNKCSVIAVVEDGVIRKLNPNPENPKSRGMLCARGNAGLLQVYDPNRLKRPLIRAGARGEGKWRAASLFAPGLNFPIFIKTNGDPMRMTPVLRREALALNQDAVFSTRLLSDATTGSLFAQHVAASLRICHRALVIVPVHGELIKSCGDWSLVQPSTVPPPSV